MKYTIKPLEWVRAEEEIAEHDDIEDKYEAKTPFGGYHIELVGNKWYVDYCFDEYYDDGCIGSAVSLEAAQAFATHHWEERLCKALFSIEEEEE